MSTLRDAMSHAALGWVKPELDETLRQARDEVEYFVESPSDADRMRCCAGYLHQVQGTLRMVELHAPALVAEELERLADAIGSGAVADRDEACATLMRGSVLLPDYLERLQNGHRDIPIVLLPLLNEIRALRGVAGIDQGVLLAFAPDSAGASEAELEHARGSLSGRNRELLDTVGSAVKEDLLRIKDALDLHLRTDGPPSQLQRQVDELGAVADTLAMMGLDVARALVVAQRDALRAVVGGDRQIDEALLLEVAGALLHVDAALDDQVAHLGAAGSGIDDPAAAETRRTVEAVAHEAIANLIAAREHVVAFIETQWNHSQLDDVPRLLGDVAGALRMLERGVPADYLKGVQQYIGVELLQRRRVPSGRQLDTLADAMASLEYYLEALRDRRPGGDDILEITRSSLAALGYWPLPAAAAVTLRDDGERVPAGPDQAAAAPSSLLFTASTAAPPEIPGWELAATRPDTTQDPGPVSAPAGHDPVPAAARPAAGSSSLSPPPWLDLQAGSLPPLPEAAWDAAVPADTLPPSLDPPGAFDPVLAERGMPPGDADRLDVQFDDGTLGDDARGTDQGLRRQGGQGEVATFAGDVRAPQTAVDSGMLAGPAAYAAASAAAAAAQAPGAQAAGSTEAGDDDVRIPAAPAVAAAAFAPDTAGDGALPGAPVAAAGVEGGFDEQAENIDQDIREVFLEEFDEAIATLGQLLPAWQSQPGNMDRLRPIRRVFHTLKGSGRLVGARVLGEFAWTIESMLNHVLGGDRPASPAVVALVEQAYQALPALNAALRGQPVPGIDLQGLQNVADRIGAGEDAFHVPQAPVATSAGSDEDGTPASVDSVLREILEAEVQAHLRTLQAWIQQWHVRPHAVSDPLLRAVHTMNGAFAMTDVPEITAVTGAAESYLKRALAAADLPSQEVVQALDDTARAIESTMQALQAEAPRIPRQPRLTERLLALAATLPEPRWPGMDEPDDMREGDADWAPAPDDAETLPRPTHAHTAADADAFYDPADAPAAHADAWDAGLAALSGFGEPVSLQEAVAEGLHVIDDSTEDAGPARFADGGLHAMEGAEASDADHPAGWGVIESAPASGLESATETESGFDAEFDAETEAETEAEAEAEAEARSAPAREPWFEMETPLAAPSPGDTAAMPSAAGVPAADALDFQVFDRELVDIFVDEGKDLLDHCDELVSELRAAADDRDVLAGLQRDLHTLKGGARMAGISAIGDLGHAIESLLEAAAMDRIALERADVRLLEQGFDRLHQMLTRIGEHRQALPADDLVATFDARSQAGAATAGTGTHAVVDPAAPPLSAPVPPEGGGHDDPAMRPQHEQVRVRADLLDRLVNHAGEVSIYRSRLEQQLGAFRGAMSELERTNARLRDQLRRLDLETEAQIVARYQREQDPADTAFDPLELDRFSTLQQLSRALNESAADLGGLQGVLDDLSRQYDSLLQQQSRVSSELQDGLMRARMVPFDSVVPRLRRVVRQAGVDTGKQVQLTLEGTHGELDRNVLERMVAPLEHMLRNSVAHGLESAAQRRAAGKPEEGEISLRLRREGSEIVLEVADDGAGLDREAIRRRAVERGLVRADAVLADSELDGLVLQAGFTTVDQLSQLAGRGVGMDVVRNEVRQLGGSVEIQSVRGQGARFTLRLPQTLAVTQAVFVQIGETAFAVPVASVSGIGRIPRARFEAGAGSYHYAGEDYALYDLGSLVGQPAARADGQAQVPLLLVRAGDLRAAVAVDQVLGNREIVVKPVGLQIASVPGIYGATITGDGRVVVILDIAPLVRRFIAHPQRPLQATAPAQQRQVPLVMVVDDSLTMRKVTGRILERHNFDVAVARDGVEALEQLEERVPDLMLLDIEMPRMDGYELAAAMRADPRLCDVPIVMITSRSGDKHRQRAFEIGVQRYLGKPYQELDLMRNVYDLLGIARVRE